MTVWFIVHRQELVEQAVNTFNSLGISMENIEVHMIQSLVNKIDSYLAPDLIIFDECHHASSNSYLKIIDKFKYSYIIGLSATPIRLDGKPLGNIFSDMVSTITSKELIKRKYLCEYDYYAPKLDIDFSSVKIKLGDYDRNSIDEILDNPRVYGDVIKYYESMAHDKQTICYCNTIKYSKMIAEKLCSSGYRAVHFDGDTPTKERKDIINRFRNKEIDILCNVDLIGEGFDVPNCDCVMLLRPTQSLGLFIQQSMRCLRPNGEKRAIILDFVGNCYRHGMPTEDRTWSLSVPIKCRNKNSEPDILVRQCLKCYKCYTGTNAICPYCLNDNGKTRKQIEEQRQAELERITEIERKDKRREMGMCRTYEQLVELGKQRNYKSPQFWARSIMQSRGNRKWNV